MRPKHIGDLGDDSRPSIWSSGGPLYRPLEGLLGPSFVLNPGPPASQPWALCRCRCGVVERRTEHGLARAQERLGIVRGLMIAQQKSDELVALLRTAA